MLFVATEKFPDPMMYYTIAQVNLALYFNSNTKLPKVNIYNYMADR